MAAADLEFRIGAELTEIKGALASLKRDFASVGQAANRAGGTNAFGGLEKSVGGAISQIRALVAGIASVAAAIKLIGAADEINTLNARLRLVTSSTDEFAQAQVKLFELAQRTRSSLGETIGLYSRIAQATKDAGVGQETLLGVVETINQAVQLSGASTQAAEAALVQLGQGLASGTLRGEELNSILEQTPALADAIAKGIGITRGELRQYGQDGKLTAEQVITALQKQRGEVASQFAQLPLTVGQSVTLLKNAGLQLLGVFDTATGATSGLADVIKQFADFISSDEVIGQVIQFAQTFSETFASIVKDFQDSIAIIKDGTKDIAGSGEDMVQIMIRAFTELPRNLRSIVRIVVVTFAGMVDSFIADAVFLKDALFAIFTDDSVEAAITRRNARVNAAAATVKDLIEEEVAGNRRAADEAKRSADAAIEARNKAKKAAGNTSQGKFQTKLTDEQKRAAEALRKAQLDAEEKLLQDSAQRQIGILEQLYEDGKLAIADYYRTRESIELSSLEKSIEIERKRAEAATGAEKVKALTEIEILERRRTDIQTKSARERVKALRDIELQLEQARAQDLENSGQTAEAAKIRLQAQYRDLINRLETEGNKVGADLIRKLIDTGVARARFDELKQQFDRVASDLQARQQQIADQRATGSIGADVANAEQSAARQNAAAELARINEQLQELARLTNDPTIVQGAAQASEAVRRIAIDNLTGIDAAVVNLRSSLANLERDFAQTATSAGVDAISGFFTDLASGTKSAGEALRDFVRTFVASMAQIAARALATFLVLQLLDTFFPGAGKLVAASGGASAGVKHRGGMVGTGPFRSVNPLLFMGAPRYHSGGMVGLKPDERPAILQTGEEVLSRTDPRNQANGGGAAPGNGYRIVNVLDPSLVAGYLESAAGERTVLNVIGRNPAQVRQIIGA